MTVIGLTKRLPNYWCKTEELIEHYKQDIDITPELEGQINSLGVKNRILLRDIRSYPDRNIRDDEAHHTICTMVGQEVIAEYMPLKFIDNLIVASEIADYQTPGLASILVRSLGLSKFCNYYNLHGTACSSFPRVEELASKLPGNTLCIINGCTSDIYQTELSKMRGVIEPKSNRWIRLMFGMLFGDGVSAFIYKHGINSYGYDITRHHHIVNLSKNDYKKASVKLSDGFLLSADKGITEKALAYCDVVMAKAGIEDMHDYDSIILHTGSKKIIDAFKERYDLTSSQLWASYDVLENFGNTTGCSLPFVLLRAGEVEKALMIGITMGFGLDLAEVKYG